MNNYFRITAYVKDLDITIVADSYGAYEKLWQFSSDLIKIGWVILQVNNATTFSEDKIPLLDYTNTKPVIRAIQQGMPKFQEYTNGEKQLVKVFVDNKSYIIINI